MPENKKYKVIISDRTKTMLGTHIRFMAQVNKKAAQKTKEQIIEALNSLSQMPERFSFFENEYMPKNKYHKMFIEKWYIVLYQIRDNTVYVEYILDYRQNLDWLLNK